MPSDLKEMLKKKFSINYPVVQLGWSLDTTIFELIFISINRRSL